MTVHDFENRPEESVERVVNDALSKAGLTLHEAENSPEVTSPHKPRKES